MKSIFLSVLTNVPEEYKKGYDNFMNLLKLQDLNPRTLGTTDFANKTPLDEVLELMYQCEGAIILAFPQMIVKDAELLHGPKFENALYLTTEWNHIEGSIAYAIGLPVLVIHDTHISRGLFDKGVLNCFLYKTDLLNDSWCTSSNISGAISKWKTLLKPLTKPIATKKGTEKPTLKWGCFTFPPDVALYCPFCYNKDGEKYLTTRDGLRKRICTNCGRTIPSK